jgi:hypothetical protein
MKFDRLINSGAGGGKLSSSRPCSISVRPVGRRFLFAFAATACAGIAASAATATPLNFQSNPMQAIFPIIVFAVVAFAYLLQRSAQLEALVKIGR